jgi:hypothetical protein
MKKLSQQPEQGANDITSDDQNHGGSHLRKVKRSKWNRAYQIACETISGIHTIEPKMHLEIILSRIRPEPTPLPEIQNSPNGWGFISDPQARIYYLREQYGFTIENSIDRSVKPARSFYWLVLDESGNPKMRPIEFEPEKTGKPSKAPAAVVAPVEPPKPITGTQSALFEDGERSAIGL